MSFYEEKKGNVIQEYFQAGRGKKFYLRNKDKRESINVPNILKALDYIRERHSHYTDVEDKLLDLLPAADKVMYISNRLTELHTRENKLTGQFSKEKKGRYLSKEEVRRFQDIKKAIAAKIEEKQIDAAKYREKVAHVLNIMDRVDKEMSDVLLSELSLEDKKVYLKNQIQRLQTELDLIKLEERAALLSSAKIFSKEFVSDEWIRKEAFTVAVAKTLLDHGSNVFRKVTTYLRQKYNCDIDDWFYHYDKVEKALKEQFGEKYQNIIKSIKTNVEGLSEREIIESESAKIKSILKEYVKND